MNLKLLSFSVLMAGLLAQTSVYAQYGQSGYYGNSTNRYPNVLPTSGVMGPNMQTYSQYGRNPATGGYGGYGGYYGQYPYANQPGYGYYTASPYLNSYPALGSPVPVNGGMFRFNIGGFSGSYWRAPSGYYYPWGAGAVFATPAPVIIVNNGSSQVAQPPVGDLFKDMSSYIEDQNTKKKLKPDDYQHLARRLRDLQGMEASMRTRNNGSLDPDDEETLRKDAAMLSGDISRRILP